MRKLNFLIIILFIINGCSTSEIVEEKLKTESNYSIIMFDNKEYSPTEPNDIIIYKSRLEIPQAFYEIGTIKFKKEISDKEIKKLSASKGAMSVIIDNWNYILIRFFNNKKKDENETKRI